MRDILFKAKRKDNGDWVEGFVVRYGWSGKEKWYIVPSYASDLYAFEIASETICQYTGLTDENKYKIWEHDIVEVPGEDEYFKLEWQEDTASFVISNDSFIVTFDNYWSHEIEVVGNMFDTPELVGGVSGEID